MNKKISTLVAALGLASVVFAPSVQAAMTAPTQKIKAIEADKAYQLYDGSSKVLVMVQNGNGYTVQMVAPADVPSINSSLWTITANTTTPAAGPDFVFVNKATGCPLTVDLSKITTTAADVVMDGSVSSWKWLPATTGAAGADLDVATGIASYFKKDSAIVLSVSGAAVQAKKVHASTVSSTATLKVAPYVAAAVKLSAKDLNTKLGTDPAGTSFKLNSDKTTSENSKLGNAFRNYTFRAWNGANNSGTQDADFIQYVETSVMSDIAADNVLLQIIDKDENGDNPFKDTYLLADTAYIDGTATNLELVKFGTDSIKAGVYGGNPYLKEAMPGRDIKSYMFQFNYYPTADSIAISVVSYNKLANTATNVNGKSTKWSTATTNKNVVTLNKLTEVTEITLTEATPGANVRFFLGLGNDGRSTEGNGLYYIKNKKGQYLAVPINEEDYDEAKWVTVNGDEQMVAHMPAYQWIVLKNNELAPLADYSSLAVANREFPDVASAALQLYKNDGASYKYVMASNNLSIAITDSVVFEQIKDKAVLGTKTLGYLDIEQKELDVMNYKLNYLNPYTTDKYIGNANDTLLSVKDAETAFYLKKGSVEKYGYVVTPAVAAKIADLVQLERADFTPYVKTAGGNKYIGLNDEHQYYLSGYTTQRAFYFKENNHYQPETADAARCYYAMIDLYDVANNDSTKVGTTDDDMAATLKNQVLHETRTSAFAVVPNDAPLYRRFNTALENAVAGQEDSTKILKFKEFYRGEYLMDENNEKFQDEVVNYAGIERADKATGLSFYVDTAIVYGTDKGQIKPQYFIYLNPEVKDAEPAAPCPLSHNHGVDANGDPLDAYHCSHATPAKAGFIKAQYLVSFADSVARPAAKADELYKFGEYTRVGFVEGLHIGDSLYILTNGFENKALADLDTAEIKAAYKKANIEFNIIDLKAERTDAHHNYTWSFRYVDPEAAAAVEEDARRFLIESAGNSNVAPINGAWLKSQNGCLVLSDLITSTFENAKTGGDNALIFNIENGSKDDLATDNETIATSAVTVIAGEGQVTIAGAQGKKVVISNILGQVVANTVITSDNAAIAAPQGVVVVAVEGEEAVKAIVK